MGGFLYQLGGFYLPMVTASGLAGTNCEREIETKENMSSPIQNKLIIIYSRYHSLGVVGLFGILAMPHLKTDHDDNDTGGIYNFPCFYFAFNINKLVSQTPLI